MTGELGRGGMGVVYAAMDELLGRPAAVKVISEDLACDEQFRTRFLREMRIAGKLEHPNVVPVYEAGEIDGRLYLATRLIDGRDLRELIVENGPLDLYRVVAIAGQLAEALDAAHRLGLIHRDVKPANVLLTHEKGSEHVYLTDFGLAREATDAGLTNTGQWLGTVDYVAPEQLDEHGVISARSDIYSMACLIFEALTAQLPYQGAVARKLTGHLYEALPSIGDNIPHSDALDRVLARAAAKDPAERYPSAGDLARALHAAANGNDPHGIERSVATGVALSGIRANETFIERPRPPIEPPTQPQRTRATSKRSPTTIALAITAALAVTAAGVAAAILISHGGSTPHATAPPPPATHQTPATQTQTEATATTTPTQTVTVTTPTVTITPTVTTPTATATTDVTTTTDVTNTSTTPTPPVTLTCGTLAAHGPDGSFAVTDIETQGTSCQSARSMINGGALDRADRRWLCPPSDDETLASCTRGSQSVTWHIPSGGPGSCGSHISSGPDGPGFVTAVSTENTSCAQAFSMIDGGPSGRSAAGWLCPLTGDETSSSCTRGIQSVSWKTPSG